MEDSLGSDSIVKRKGSSGCLIIKKKGQSGNGEGTGSSMKKKKRPRELLSDSGSSDELLETMRRKTRAKTNNREVGSRRSAGDDGKFGSQGEFECEKKSAMDLFEFDEYDEFEGYKVRNEYADGNNISKMGREPAGSSQDFQGSGSRKNLKLQKRKHSCIDGANSAKSGKSQGIGTGGDMTQPGLDETEAQLPISLLNLKNQKTPEEPIRVQGKNGVLKVKVNNNEKEKKKKTDVFRDDCEKEPEKNQKSSRGKEKDRLSEPITPVVSKIETIIPSEGRTPAKGNEFKPNGSGSTGKQQLRETIREMLIDAGWTIDYRPRRNRDYLDAVYIHPSGTTYWSITKAYEALQRQFNDQQGRSKSAGLSSSFVPISEELISKLTRQTRKKIKEKMKKRRVDGMPKTSRQTAKKEYVEAMDSDQPEETLSSFIRQKRKSSKNKTHDLCHENVSESMDYSRKRTNRGDGVDKSLGSVIERCTLRIRDLNKTQNSGSDGYIAYSGKRTVLAWLVDSGIIQSGKKVQYMNRRRTRIRLQGWITKEGIHCGCCSKIVTVSKFELHAGSKLGQPFQNIFLESGVSLLQCQIDAWNQQDRSERQNVYSIGVDADDPDDDTCGTCGDGGDLICCDSCPSTFHQSCLEIKMVPLGDWHCPNCVCKFCGTASRNDAGCDLSGDKLTTCSLCERKYHKLCCTDNGTTTVDSSSRTAQFCGHKCEELYDHVGKILGVKHELEAGFSWSLIRRTNIDCDLPNSGFAQKVECNSKLAVAQSVMDECFLPIIDRRTGINLIHSVLYSCGANFPRLNFGSFYNAILERGDDLVSVASIRIHGTRLAEMPFIGTRHIYRRQGMCSRLLSAIESVLSSFKVEKLIIPAISEHTSTWTAAFGFSPLEEDTKKEIKSINMLVFPGTDMLQKQLMKPITNVDHCALTRKSTYVSSGDDEDVRKDPKVHLNKNLDKFEVDSAAPNITGTFAPPAPDSTSKSGIQLSVVETALDQNNQILVEMDGNDSVHSDVASGADVNIQATPCEVKKKYHDTADSSFDSVPTDVNGMSSHLEDVSENRHLTFSTDFKDEVAIDALTNTSLGCGVGNNGDKNAVGVSFEHTNAFTAPEEINEQSNISCPVSEGVINSESCVKQSDMKSEPCEASTHSCKVNVPTISNVSSNAELDSKYSSVQALPDSSNVYLPQGAVEVHKKEETVSLSAFHRSTQNTISFGAIPAGCHDLMTSRGIFGDITDPSELTIHSNGKDELISNETVPIEATTRSYGPSKVTELSEVVEEVD